MKYRFGFVSNSSSTSFAVVRGLPDCGPNLWNWKRTRLNIVRGTLYFDGTFTFGGGGDTVEYRSLPEKIAWAYLLAQNFIVEGYDKSKFIQAGAEAMTMLEKVLKETLGVNNIVWQLVIDDDTNDWQKYSYIDHQSVHPENLEDIFSSEMRLRCFLFSPDSYVQGGNDSE